MKVKRRREANFFNDCYYIHTKDILVFKIGVSQVGVFVGHCCRSWYTGVTVELLGIVSKCCVI